MAGNINIHSRLLSGLWIMTASGLSAYALRRWSPHLTKSEEQASAGMWWLTTLTLTLVLGAEVARGFLSIAWGPEGIMLYTIGFAQQSLNARRQGLAVMGLTIAKVYVYDVWSLSPANRILSFIILGVLLLIVGYLYNRWRQKTKVGDQTNA